MRWLKIVGLAVLAVLLMPEPAWAWGPGMHILVGTEILAALGLLPAAVAGILRRYPYDFLYGCISADISFGKKYAPVGRNCHHWHVGEELFGAADTDAKRACALGYLTHLAGDTIAHNYFLPRKLVTSANTQAIGHSYWEHRMDVHLGQAYLRAAFHLITDFDQTQNDALMDRILDRTVLSFQMNRRLFEGMIRLADHSTWKVMFDRVLDYSRWDVDDHQVATWIRYTFDYSADYLIKRKESTAAFLDPTGERALGEAKMLNRQVGLRKTRRQDEAAELAEARFALPPKLDWFDERLSAEGMWIDLVHLKAHLIRPKKRRLRKRKKKASTQSQVQ
jgi:hypothetical protein